MSQQRQNSGKGSFGSSNARVSGRDFRYSWQGFWVMSQQRQNSRKDNFGSSNARVSGIDFLYSFQVLFEWCLYRDRNSNSDNFGSPNARVSGRDFRYSKQSSFKRYCWKTGCTLLPIPKYFDKGKSPYIEFYIIKFWWQQSLSACKLLFPLVSCHDREINTASATAEEKK